MFAVFYWISLGQWDWIGCYTSQGEAEERRSQFAGMPTGIIKCRSLCYEDGEIIIDDEQWLGRYSLKGIKA